MAMGNIGGKTPGQCPEPTREKWIESCCFLVRVRTIPIIDWLSEVKNGRASSGAYCLRRPKASLEILSSTLSWFASTSAERGA